uniref:Reverse transcriptase n=1 Tax=Globodera pallida TaxID=36090 RepID=A0A183CIF4_GLOPA
MEDLENDRNASSRDPSLAGSRRRESNGDFVTPLAPRQDGQQGDEGEDEGDNRLVWGLNMLSGGTVGSNLEMFGEESAFAFDEWAERFKDYLSISGKTYSESEKVTRFKLALKDTPRALFKELLPVQTANLDSALAALRAKLDSPQRREVAKRTLTLSRQREDESVAQFLRRLTPLVEASNPSLNEAQRKEKVCEEFLDRLKPNMSFLIRLVGLTQAKDLDIVKAQAEELEALLLMNRGDDANRLSQAVNVLNNRPAQTQWNVSSAAATGANAQGPSGSNVQSFRPFLPPNAQRQQQSFGGGRGGFRNWGRGRQEQFSQRNWSSNPRCHYCQRVGHFAYACQERRNNFQSNRGRPFRQVRWVDQQPRQAQGGWQNRPNPVNSVDAPSLPSNSPGFMENLVRSLVEMNVRNNPSSRTAGEEGQASGSMNTIAQIEQKEEMPMEEKVGSRVAEKEEETIPACGPEAVIKHQPKTSNWEGTSLKSKVVSLSFISMMIFALCSVANGFEKTELPSHPLICQTQRGGKVWQLPEVTGCSKHAVNHSKSPVPRALHIFAQNVFEHSVDAWTCRKVRKAVRKYTSITNVPVQEMVEPQMQEVSLSECRQMVEDGKCSLGVLVNESGLLHTDKRIDLSPRMWLVGSFSWTTAMSENCYLFKSKVTVAHGESGRIQSPLGPTGSCQFGDGQCSLEDKTRIIWDTNRTANCEFSKVGTWKGLQLDNVWVSDEVSFRLTFRNESRKVYSCGQGLQKSEEGFAVQDVAIKKGRRTRRSTESLVTESELNAELGYLDEKVRELLTVSFSQMVKSICDYMVETRRWAATALLSDPTAFARKLFQSGKLVAKAAGPELIKVWPCVELGASEYEFVQVGKDADGKPECFDQIPIKFRTKGTEQMAFVDPRTMIVNPTARKAPCAEFQQQFIFVRGVLLEVDQVSAQVRQVKVDRIAKLGDGLPATLTFSRHNFLHLALVNISDVLGQAYEANLARVSELTYKIRSRDTAVTKTLSDQWEEVSDQVRDKIFGNWVRMGQTLLAVMTIIVFVDFVVRFGLMLRDEYRGRGISNRMAFGTGRGARQVDEPPTQSVSAIAIGAEPGVETEEPEAALTPIKLIESMAAPARKRMRRGKRTRFSLRMPKAVISLLLACLPFASAQTAQLDQESQFLITSKEIMIFLATTLVFLIFWAMSQNSGNKSQLPRLPNLYAISPQHAVVQVTINARPVRCLMDTGASLTVAPRSVASELKCRIVPADLEAMSASGHIIRLRECAQISLNIAGVVIQAVIYFVADSEFTVSRDYSVIIGWDVFEQLPAITFDHLAGKFFVGNHEAKLCHRSAILLSNIRISALEDILIPADSQVLVNARIEVSPAPKNPVVIDRPDRSLLKKGLFVVNSVSPAGKEQLKIALVNPTMEPKSLWKGTHLAYANELMCERNGLLREGCAKQISVVESSKGMAVDPAFVVDFSKTAVEGNDLMRLKALIEEFSDIFSKFQYDLGLFTAAEHHITTTTEEPVASPPRRMPYKYKEELKKHIDQLLASGVMIESDTPWVTPIVIVQKKDGGIRPCLDFRKLNEVTIPDRYPLPRLDSIMERVGSCAYYTSLDLASGYLQIKLSDETSRKCGVITEDSVFQMMTMPFGMKNATAAFSRAMAVVLSGLDGIALAYVDDILIFTKEENFEEHLAAVRKVLERFRLYNLKLSPKKCTFASKEMNFLGFVLNSGGFKPSLSRIEILKEMPTPTSVKEVKRVLGQAGFYRRHIENFAMVVEPICFYSRTSGVVLQQDTVSSGKEVACRSDVELHTDHKPLAFLLKKSESSPQLARWMIELQNYHIKIVHVAGKENTLADALSRAAEDKPFTEMQSIDELEDIIEFPEDGGSYEVKLEEEQMKDPEAVAYIEFVRNGEFPAGLDEKEKETFAVGARLDLAGPFPMTQKGNKHILNIVCWFTKYVISVPVPDTKARTIAQAFLNHCYLKFGGCTELITDNATAFTSEFFREFCSMLYIDKKYACPHWSQGNASTERTFRTFHNILAKYISRNQPDFDEFLDAACFCYNTSVHASTDRGEFKQKMIVAIREAWHAASEEYAKAQLKMKEQYDRRARPQQVQEGDRVLIRNYEGRVGTSKKFQLPWRGIFRVVEVDGIHVTVVKKCFEMLGPTCTFPTLPADEKEALDAAGAADVGAQSQGEETRPSGGEENAEDEIQNVEDSRPNCEAVSLACGPEAVKNGNDGGVGQGCAEPSSSEPRRVGSKGEAKQRAAKKEIQRFNF